jgi:two-component system, sensor histidine kinase PdtaS
MSRPLIDFLHPDDAQPTLDEIARRRVGDSRNHFENRYRTYDGEYRWFEWRCVLASDGNLYAGGRDITDQKESNQALQEQVERNKVLLKELRHRVKNSLASVAGLLSISAETEDGKSSRESILEARSRIDSVSKMYEYLHYNEGGTVDLSMYVEDLSRSVIEAYCIHRGMELEVKVAPLSGSADNAVPIGLILNELLTNIFKHAYAPDEAGQIRVKLRSNTSIEEPTAVLSVTDYGSGFPDGFNVNQSTGTGLSLIQTLVEQLDGSLTVSTDDGNTVSVHFPYSPRST